MRLGGSLALLLALCCGITAAETRLDEFQADGKTSYCKVTRGLPTTPFSALQPSNTGRCPVDISMTVSVKSFTAESMVLDVTWSLSLNANRSEDEFPLSVFENTFTFAHKVVACTVDSDCGTLEDLEGSVANDDEFPDTVDLTSKAPIKLTSYRLRLPPTSDYVVVGDVSIANDDGKMVEVYAFQRVRAAADPLTPPATVRPDTAAIVTPTETPVPSSTTNPIAPIPTGPAVAPEPTDLASSTTSSSEDQFVWVPLQPGSTNELDTIGPTTPAVSSHSSTSQSSNSSVFENSEKGAALSSPQSSSNSMNAIGFASIGVVGLVAAAIYFTANRGEKTPNQSTDNARNTLSL